MSSANPQFSSQDITTIYDALKGCTGKDLSQALLGSEAHPSKGRRLCVQQLASRRIDVMLFVLYGLEPNLEASSNIIMPWKPSHLAALSNMSWPDALGSKIVLPGHFGPNSRNRMLANVLLNMSYL